jgi:hypothetical protein
MKLHLQDHKTSNNRQQTSHTDTNLSSRTSELGWAVSSGLGRNSASTSRLDGVAGGSVLRGRRRVWNRSVLDARDRDNRDGSLSDVDD